MQRTGVYALLLGALVLAGCGDTVGKQSLYGGAAGALAAEALGGDWALGALLGSAANVIACDRAVQRCR